MTSATEILRAVQSHGGQLWLVDGERLRYRLPESLMPLVDALREHKGEIIELLAQRPSMPPGVTLQRWNPVASPVRLNRWLTVLDTDKFIRKTLEQLAAKRAGADRRAGNWSMEELMERLERVGVTVTLVEHSQQLQ